MGYVIAAIVVVLLVGAFLFFLVNNAARKSNVSDAGDPGADQNPLGIVGSDDETPAGDTSQHSETESRPKGRGHGEESGVARPVVGGEGEGKRSAH
jgi:hypothetical protein